MLGAVLGSTLPRLATEPLIVGLPGPCVCGCALTEDTSYGYDVIWFAEHVLGTPLDPWEELAVIHGGELLPDDRPRFRKLLILVARQQGKTLLARVLTLYWLFIERWPMILGTSTNLGYAKESWNLAVALAESTPDLAVDIPPNGVRKAAGEECLTTRFGARYRIAASNRKGGRSLTINRLILDELREHDDWSAWGAAYPAMNAVPDAQVIAISNMGDATSVVLNSLRSDAIKFIETGKGDYRLGLLEWSCPQGADPEDPHALAMSNPNLGRRTALEDLLADARRAKENGGEELATFKTEVMCILVPQLHPAIDLDGWAAGLEPASMDGLRDRVALCLDVAVDQSHVTLCAAAVQADGRVRGEVVRAWSGIGCTAQLRQELPSIVAGFRISPRVVGWFPDGPAAGLMAAVADPKKRNAKAPRGRVAWPPQGVKVAEIRAETAAVCMGLAEQVLSRQVVHSGDPLLDQHVQQAQKLNIGKTWVFCRSGAGPIDATYALAGAVHLARILPKPVGKPRLVVPEVR